MILHILVIVSLAYCIKNISGPFNMISKIKMNLLHNKYVGKFFYELFSCIFCIGFHCGYIIYMLTYNHFNIMNFIFYGFMGAICSLIVEGLINKLHE